ncbi:MAG: type II toxin-antitoxin system RelE/ParE family toxin [Bacteroidetes bacterium]|nr:type II toxin-antitoxin system RelE/ParE family toxin [Bacteroidota bacterium]
MAYKIIWSPEAIHTFDSVIEYLEAHWTHREIIKLIQRANDIEHLLEKNPYLFRGSDKENIHEALVTKHNLLLYQINDEEKLVELLSFWDTRQNPKKKSSGD